MKTKREISGIYFRVKNEVGKFENVVFEDLTETQQDEVMIGRSDEWLKGLAKGLAKNINLMADQFNIVAD